MKLSSTEFRYWKKFCLIWLTSNVFKYSFFGQLFFLLDSIIVWWISHVKYHWKSNLLWRSEEHMKEISHFFDDLKFRLVWVKNLRWKIKMKYLSGLWTCTFFALPKHGYYFFNWNVLLPSNHECFFKQIIMLIYLFSVYKTNSTMIKNNIYLYFKGLKTNTPKWFLNLE